MTYDLLAGTRIIESSAFIAAPLGGLMLAQMGAEVIRVDAIGGGIDYRRLPRAGAGRSIYWTSLNKGKRSIAVDLRRPEGQELVAALVAAPGPGGGILLTNIAARWLDSARLARERPDLISCTIEGQPGGGTAVDYTVNCAVGLPAMTGPQDGAAPVNHVLPAWDNACALQAAMAVLAALLRRRSTGEGAEIRLALSDVAFTTMAHLGYVTEAELLGEGRPRLGNDIYGAFGRDFATADGQRVMIAAISARQWAALVAACGMQEMIAATEAATGLDFADEADRFAGRDLIGAVVRRWCAARPLDEVARSFDAAGVCWGQYRTIREALDQDPRLSLRNEVFEMLETEGIGRHLSAGSALRFAGLSRRPTRPAPPLGADTDRVLAEVLGLDSGAIGRLHDRGIVAGPDRAEGRPA